MINIGVSFSIFLNLHDCQEYGPKENVLDLRLDCGLFSGTIMGSRSNAGLE